MVRSPEDALKTILACKLFGPLEMIHTWPECIVDVSTLTALHQRGMEYCSHLAESLVRRAAPSSAQAHDEDTATIKGIAKNASGQGDAEAEDHLQLQLSVERNVTEAEIKFTLLQVFVRNVLQNICGAGSPCVDASHYLYSEALSVERFEKQIEQAAALSLPTFAWHRAPLQPSLIMGDGKEVRSILVGTHLVPPMRQCEQATAASMSGCPSMQQWSSWQDQQNTQLINQSVFYQSKEDATGQSYVTREAQRVVLPHDGSVVVAATQSGGSSVTVTKDDVVCGLRSRLWGTTAKPPLHPHYFTATFDDGTCCSVSVQRRCGDFIRSQSRSPEGEPQDSTKEIRDGYRLCMSFATASGVVSIDDVTGDVRIVRSVPLQRSVDVLGGDDKPLVVRSVEEEIEREVANIQGHVTCRFRSGLVQRLYANGAVASRCANDTRSLLILPGGERRIIVSKGGPAAEILTPIEVRTAHDSESQCEIHSRNDFVTMIHYVESQHLCVADGPELSAVTLHADDTVIMQFFPCAKAPPTTTQEQPSPLQPRCTPTPDGGMARGEGSALSCRFRLECPGLPTITIQAPPQVIPGTSIGDVFIEFSDGTVLRRAREPQTGWTETAVFRPVQTTIRLRHDHGLVFVEPHSVQFMERSVFCVGACEGVHIFDPITGSYRLTDFKHVNYEISTVIPEGCTSAPQCVTVQSSLEELVLQLAPCGLKRHVEPTSPHSSILVKSNQQKEEARTKIAQQHAALEVPPMQTRLRDIVSPFVVEHDLVTASRQLQINLRKTTTMNSTLRSAMATIGAADPSNRELPDNAPRPLIYVLDGDGRATRLLCSKDLAPFVHLASKPSSGVVVCRGEFGGEPGIQQLTFLRSQRKMERVGDASPWGYGLTLPDGQGPVALHQCVPRVLHPVKSSSLSKICPDLANKHDKDERQVAERTVVRYVAMTKSVQRLVFNDYAKKVQRDQKGVTYATSLRMPDPRSDEDRATEAQLLEKHREKLQSYRSAQRDSASPQRSPSQVVGKVSVPETQKEHQPALEKTPQLISMEKSTVEATPVVVAVPNIVEFGPLPTNFRYSITVTLRNLTTNAILFHVRRVHKKSSPLQIHAGSGLISPMSTSAVIIVLCIAPDMAGPVEERLYVDCQYRRDPLVIPVTATAVPCKSGDPKTDYLLMTHVRVLGAL